MAYGGVEKRGRGLDGGAMSIPKDDPVLVALEEGFAEMGIDLPGAEQGARAGARREPPPRNGRNEMLPKEKTPPRTSLSDLTVLVHGRPKCGKCVSADTLVVDPVTARPVAIRDLVAGGSASVLTLRDGGVIASQRPSAYLVNEPAQLYRLTTQTGRAIEATANHPFLTRDGWKPLSELGPSDRVAVVAEYPSLFGLTRTDDALLKILAYLIADGTLGGLSAVFTKKDPEVRMDFEAAVEAKGDECVEFVGQNGVPHVRVRGKRGSANNVIAYLKEVGLQGLRSAEKFIPDFVFGLEKEKLGLFLNRLFTCDGSVEASGRISYSSTSVRMVRQVQHLLSRFGIVSVIREKFREGAIYGAELLVSSKANVLRFIDEIGFFGEKAVKAESVRASLYNVRGAETQLDRLGPVLFDRVASVEPTEVASVYDLTVEGSHNFVANDFVVHNSTLCSHAPGALFLATEAGLNSLEVFQIPISTWEEFLKACGEVAAGGHDFKTIVVDTLDNAYRMCSEHVCAKHKIEHESDLGYGKGFALVNSEFHRVLNKLSLLPYGLFLVSHSQEKEIETRAGKRTRIVPSLPEKARQMVLGMADIILYCDVETVVGPDGKPRERRVMRTKPTETYEAGDRTGRLPDVLDLDYAKFAQAFAGGQVQQMPGLKDLEGAKGAEGTQPQAQPESARTPAPSETSAPESKPRATDEQVREFEALVADLKVPPETVKQRLAHLGATAPPGLAAEDMESVLSKLRAAKARRSAGSQESKE